MHTWMRLVAATQVVLLVPAALFLSSVLVAAGDPPQYDLARFAQQIVTWYAVRRWTAPVLLVALPLGVLETGGATLLHSWDRHDDRSDATPLSLGMIPAPLATLVVGGMTMISAGIVGLVVLHTLAN